MFCQFVDNNKLQPSAQGGQFLWRRPGPLAPRWCRRCRNCQLYFACEWWNVLYIIIFMIWLVSVVVVVRFFVEKKLTNAKFINVVHVPIISKTDKIMWNIAL